MPTVGSYFRSALNAYIAARERQAQRYVNGALFKLDDTTLMALNYKRGELSKRGE